MRKLAAAVLVCLAVTSTAQPYNGNPKVWLSPVPGGDLIRAVQHPELWREAQRRIDVFSFFVYHASGTPESGCGPCGENTYRALMDAVPGGAFKRIRDLGMELGLYVGSVKEYACTPDDVRTKMVPWALEALGNIERTGVRVSYLIQDDPFAAGVGNDDPPEYNRNCGLTSDETAELIKLFAAEVRERYPHVRVGLDDPYPYFSADQVITHLLALEHAGAPVAFLHLDFDLQRAVREHRPAEDLRRIHEFCRARGIPFGAITWGEANASNAAFASQAWANLRFVSAAVGVTEHLPFESWTKGSAIPDIVPESDPSTHTGQLLAMLKYLGVQPAP